VDRQRGRCEDLFLAQKIEVGVTAGASIDDGGKVSGEIVGVTTLVIQRKCKGNLQCHLRRPNEVSASPRLAINRPATA